MFRDLFNLAELLAAAGIGVFVGGVIVMIATARMRNDAADDRAVAAEDLAKVAAGLVRMDSARSTLLLAPAYMAHTAQFEMIADEPEPPVADLATARDCDGYMWQEQGGAELGMWCVLDGGESVGEAIDLDTLEHEHGPVTIIYPDGSEGSAADLVDRPEPDSIGEADGIPDVAAPASTELVPVVDEPPVTADDLAPIGPDRMPAVSWRGWALLAFASVPVLIVLVLVALAALVWLGWDRTAEWWTARRARRAAEPVLVLEHPAPAKAYEARHRAVKR